MAIGNRFDFLNIQDLMCASEITICKKIDNDVLISDWFSDFSELLIT